MTSKNFKLPSPMTHDFSRVTNPQITRTAFRRSRSHKTTFNAARLIPIFIDIMFPSETMSVRFRANGRLSTMLNPIMDNIYLDTFFFKIPIRLLWEKWTRFMGERKPSPDSSIDFLVPQINMMGQMFDELSLGDYFRLATKVEYGNADDYPNALFFRAYNLVYNEWFRDQNFQTEVPVNFDSDGPDSLLDYNVLKRGKRHDYFTSSLPFAQKGEPVQLPLGLTAPVVGDGNVLGLYGLENDNVTMSDFALGITSQSGAVATMASLGAYFPNPTFPVAAGAGVSANLADRPRDTRAIGVSMDPALSGLYADLSTATSATINQLRLAFATQQILERDARGGTRYTELNYAHFGVKSSDARLQRPEYIGGSTSEMTTMMVPQMSASVEGSPQGNLAAYGEFSTSARFMTSSEEHCLILGLVNVRTDLTYQQGNEAHWNWRTRYDWYLPALANIGEQPIYNREIFFGEAPYDNGGVFGYQEAWAPLRYAVSGVSGLFRSNATQSLDTWVLTQDFLTPPVLNGQFIEDNSDVMISRVVVDETQPQVLLDSYAEVNHIRPLPAFSNPGLGHL